MATIAEARKAAGTTQKELAAALHVSPQTISSWERGRTSVPDSQRRRLAQVLGAEIDHPVKPEPDPAEAYPHSPSDVLFGFPPEQRNVIRRAAEAMKTPRPKNQHARRAAAPETVVRTAFPKAGWRLQARLLGAAGSYAKAKGWYTPEPQGGTS